MSTKVFNTRLQLKYDSYANWSATEKQFKLLAGEIAVVNVPAETGADGIVHEPAILFKVGDGEKTFNQLPWASGLAADVYGWAKAENKPDYKASEIAVEDTSAFFEGANVESVLAEIWTEITSLTGGEEGTGSIATQIAAGINALGSVSAAEGKYVSGVKVVEGKLAIEEKALPDYSNTYAAKSLEQTVADHIEAVRDYDSRITAAQSQADKGVADAAAAKSAADAAQATANAAYVLPEGGIEEDLSEAVKASLAKANSAVQDISHLATKDELSDVSDRVETIENDYLKAADKTELEGKITTAETNAKAYADDIKEAILGGEGLKDTFDTLLEIQNWIEGDGVNTTELTTAIAAEAKTREDADTALSNRIKAYEDVKDTYALKTEVVAAEGRASADATTKANTAETNAKAYADAEIDKVEAEVAKKANTADLHKVATSGKIEDLDQEVEYIIFNCGTATTLVSDPIT